MFFGAGKGLVWQGQGELINGGRSMQAYCFKLRGLFFVEAGGTLKWEHQF